jgi:hypothetical protein
VASIRSGGLGIGTAGFVLRSRDHDRLRWSAALVTAGHTLSRAGGTLRPRASRTVQLPSRGRTRARLVVSLTDPQGNTRRVVRRLRR